MTLAVVHEWAFFGIIGRQFQALMSPTDYLFSGLQWLPLTGAGYLGGIAVNTLLSRAFPQPELAPDKRPQRTRKDILWLVGIMAVMLVWALLFIDPLQGIWFIPALFLFVTLIAW